MVEQYLVWVLLVGIAAGAAVTWFVVGRLPRRSDDISPPELAAEADWISRAIELRGGVAPASLVEEVLELHLEYVAGDPIEIDESAADGAELEPEQGAPRSQPPGRARERPSQTSR